jgi:adenosine kinase
VHIAVAASIASDHLMTYEGRFSESLLAEQLDKVSLSFLVTELEIRRGGVAANIAFGLGNLGLRPLLVGGVGPDFGEYRTWLEQHGVDCSGVLVSSRHHTARFVCTTDRDQAQIASFYAGAMSEGRNIGLGPLHADRPLDLVLIGADDPEGMLRHTRECRELGIPFAADPSQQLAWSDGPAIKQYVDGATYLFSNDYESGLIEQKTGWSVDDLLARVQVKVTTHGEKGVVIEGRGIDRIEVPIVPARTIADPTGVGDGFRAGFLAGLAWGLTLERCAQVGAALATLVIETVGPQEYDLAHDGFLERIRGTYGQAAVDDVAPHLSRTTVLADPQIEPQLERR